MDTTVARIMTACPAERAMRAVEGRWKIFIVFYLLEKTMRFAELQRAISETNSRSITAKMLTQELREMEGDGLVHREVYPQVPPKVEYSLTVLGRNLRVIVDAMSLWGQQAEQLSGNTEVPPKLKRAKPDRDTSKSKPAVARAHLGGLPSLT